jgi:hypothetical protein
LHLSTILTVIETRAKLNNSKPQKNSNKLLKPMVAYQILKRKGCMTQDKLILTETKALALEEWVVWEVWAEWISVNYSLCSVEWEEWAEWVVLEANLVLEVVVVEVDNPLHLECDIIGI